MNQIENERIKFDQLKYAAIFIANFNREVGEANRSIDALKQQRDLRMLCTAATNVAYLCGLRSGLQMLVDCLDDCIQKEGLRGLSETEIKLKTDRAIDTLNEAIDECAQTAGKGTNDRS